MGQSPTLGKSTFLTFKSPLEVVLPSSLTMIFAMQHAFLALKRQILLLRLPEDWRPSRRPPSLIRQSETTLARQDTSQLGRRSDSICYGAAPIPDSVRSKNELRDLVK